MAMLSGRIDIIQAIAEAAAYNKDFNLLRKCIEDFQSKVKQIDFLKHLEDTKIEDKGYIPEFKARLKDVREAERLKEKVGSPERRKTKGL